MAVIPEQEEPRWQMTPPQTASIQILPQKSFSSNNGNSSCGIKRKPCIFFPANMKKTYSFDAEVNSYKSLSKQKSGSLKSGSMPKNSEKSRTSSSRKKNKSKTTSKTPKSE